MAIVEEPIEKVDEVAPLELEATQRSARSVRVRVSSGAPPTPTAGRRWFTSVDHKRVGIMYGAAVAVLLHAVAGLEAGHHPPPAGPCRTRRCSERGRCTTSCSRCTAPRWCSSSIIPLGAPRSSNYLIPLQIGARDVAFPRLNAFSFWTVPVRAVIFFNLAWFTGGGADCGWFCYAPNSGAGVLQPGQRRRLLRDSASRSPVVASLGRCHQPHRHGHQPSGPRHDDDEDAGLHLDGLRRPASAALRRAGHLDRPVPVDLRPALRRQLLQRRRWAPTRCSGSTSSGSSVTPRCTS